VHQRVAQSYRRALLLAGDAAHLNNPLGGMGLNGIPTPSTSPRSQR
jgi:3-(3-hydroxy-phenyl)propionate hydroxylase